MFNKFSIQNGKVVDGMKGDKGTSFYALDKNTRPIPPYTYLIVFTDKRVYNQYNIYERNDSLASNSLSLITWIEPVPYTTPLFIYENKDGVYSSFDEKPPSDDYSQIEISPVYVLTATPLKNTIKSATQPYFTPPKFLFKIYMGRIIPDPEGKELEDLMKIHPKPVSLKDTLSDEYAYRNTVRIIVCILLVLFVVLFYTYEKKYE
jgi:hypothetical protein